MALCSLRSVTFTTCTVQLIFTICRQVFDFLGYMWVPILVNFFQIIFIIFGIFGIYQYRPYYIIAYSIWCIFSCCWNIFIVCFYNNLLGLDKESNLLNINTWSVSWWESNGPGCKPIFSSNLSSLEVAPWKPLRPDSVTGCLLPYHHLETAQAFLHLIMAVSGLASSAFLSWYLLDEDDSFLFLGAFESKSPQHVSLQPKLVQYTSVSSQPDNLLTNTKGFMKSMFNDGPARKKKKTAVLPPLYSIEYSIRRTSYDADDLSVHELPEEDPESRLSSPRPMTPRRVKRRSVNSRGLPLQKATPPISQYHSSQRHSNHARSSTRSSQRKNKVVHQNPVTRLIDQQQKQDVNRLMGHTNPMYQQSSTHSLDQECERPSSARSVYSNYHGTRAFSYMGGPPSTFLSKGPPAYDLFPPNKTETVI